MSTDESFETPSATVRAFEALKHDIMRAELRPGEHVLEGDLAKRLGMSRTPVREACIRLEAEGLVQIIPRRGIRIVPVSPDDMAELYDLLGTLEGRAAELAAERADPDALDALDRAADRMEAALDADDLDEWAAADDAFHRALMLAAGNRHMARTAAQYADLVHRARMLTLRIRPWPIKSAADHRALANAVRDGDGARARDLHVDHRRNAAATLVELLETLSLPEQ